MDIETLSTVERHLLNDFQHEMPLTVTPFADMAGQLGIAEEKVLEHLTHLQQQGVVSRVGPVLATHRLGASTLAAMAVSEAELEAVAQRISEHPAVNHNYEREHHFNIWFVVTAADELQLAETISELERATGYPALVLPMVEDYHIDLGFEL